MAHNDGRMPIAGVYIPFGEFVIRYLNFRTLKGFNTSAQGIALRENGIEIAHLTYTIFFYLYGH